MLATALVSWLIVSAPQVASACSVCTAGRDEENAAAFLLSTIFMSILPLLALGTLLFVIRRRYRKLAAEEQDDAGNESRDRGLKHESALLGR